MKRGYEHDGKIERGLSLCVKKIERGLHPLFLIPRQHLYAPTAILAQPTMDRPTLSIIYHGNCIDGWMSAYIIYTAKIASHSINFYPISPNLSQTWPKIEEIKDTDVIMTDVSVPKETLTIWREAAFSFFWIDHHPSSKSLHDTYKDQMIHDDHCCAALLAWRHYFPDDAVPEWLHQINRIDLWIDVTEDDKALREILHPIAQKLVRGGENMGICETADFVESYKIPEEREKMFETGRTILRKKEEELDNLFKLGEIIHITPDLATFWGLDDHWIDQKGFVIDTTGVAIDSTGAADYAMRKFDEITFFINYRMRKFVKNGKTEYSCTYSARSRRDFDLTSDGIFAGHTTAAGATKVVEQKSATKRPLPFVTPISC